MGLRHGLIRALVLILWDCSLFCLFVVMTSSSHTFCSWNGKAIVAITALYPPTTPSKFEVSGFQSSQQNSELCTEWYISELILGAREIPCANWPWLGLSRSITLIRKWVTLIG